MNRPGVLVVRILAPLIIVIFASAQAGRGSNLEQHLYHFQIGASGHNFELSYTFGTMASIRVDSPNSQELGRCDDKGGTLRWRLEIDSAQTAMDVIRQQNSLQLSGKLAGKQLKRSVSLDDAPWFQFLSWSLRDFLRSDEDHIRFWSLRPETMKAYKMEAEKRGLTTIDVNGVPQAALQVRIHPAGLLSAFWHGDYWFDPGSLVFLRYESVDGPPGSPKTGIEHLRTLSTDG